MSVHRGRNGTYRVCWRENGRQRQKTFRTRKLAEKADRAIDDRLALAPFGVPVEVEPMTGDELYADWTAHYAEANLAEHTRDAYRSTYRAHLQPRIGDMDVRALTPAFCQNLAAELVTAKVGQAARAKALALLSTLLRRAVVTEKIPYHPMRGAVKVPQPDRQRVINPPGPEAIWKTADRLEVAEDDEGRILVLLCGFAGLRPEEALALDYGGVGKRTLNVAHAIAKGTRKKTKTERERTVDLLPALEREIVAYRLRAGLPDQGLLIARPDGKPWADHDYRNWRARSFKPAAKGLVTVPKDLRHAYASLLIHEGRSVIEVAAQLGHSPTVCLNTYGHVIQELRNARRVKASTAVERARKATSGSGVGPLLVPQDPGRGAK